MSGGYYPGRPCDHEGCTGKAYEIGWNWYPFCREHVCQGSKLCRNARGDEKNKGVCDECVEYEKKRKRDAEEEAANTVLTPISSQDKFKDVEFYLDMEDKEWSENDICNYLETKSQEFKKPATFTVKKELSGNFRQIGSFYKHPMTLDFSFCKVNGHRVCFVSPASEMVYYPLLRKWTEQNLPGYKEAHSPRLSSLLKFGNAQPQKATVAAKRKK